MKKLIWNKLSFFLLAMAVITGSVGQAGQVHAAASASGQWMWEDGDDIREQSGVYAGLLPLKPGAREFPNTWTDSSGNPWMFGGLSRDMNGDLGFINDMWKFDVAAREWKRKDGPATLGGQPVNYGTQNVYAATNLPPGREAAATWVDGAGYFWMYGGRSYDTSAYTATYYNDLWKFNPATAQWVWISGSSTSNQNGNYGTQGTGSASNYPGARYRSATWVDNSGNFWLFGGHGLDDTAVDPDLDSGYLNDTWKYNPNTGAWTWVRGSKVDGDPGTYGTQGVATASNTPGVRNNAISWKDNDGSLWLFGGYGRDGRYILDANHYWGYMNDIWKLNPSNGQWAWMGGSYYRNQLPSYGVKGTEISSNNPGGRDRGGVWVDSFGTFWLFGGDSWEGYHNDLWKYNPSTGNWSWVDGSQDVHQAGIYGTKDLPGSSNLPGSRTGSGSWVDGNGDFWLFGGNGNDNSPNWNRLNDLWVFSDLPDSSLISQAAADGFVLESSETSKKGGTKNNTAQTFNLGDDAAKKQYLGILSFNTTLPAGAQVVSVTLMVKKAGVVGGGNPVNTFGGFIAQVKTGSFGKSALQTSDFQAAASASTPALKPALIHNWYSIDLNSVKGKINTSGITQIRLKFKKDDNNNLVANYLKLYSGNATSANRPQLIVEYYLP